jgi:hypothetical protein
MDIYNWVDIYPLSIVNEDIKEAYMNNVAAEINTLLGPDAWRSNVPVKVVGKNIAFKNNKYVVLDDQGKDFASFDKSTEAIQAILSMNKMDADAKIEKTIKETLEEFEKFLPTESDMQIAEEFVKVSGKVNANGTFQGGFDGCVKHMQESKHLPEANAEKLCAYIGRNAGKIKSDAPKNGKPANGKTGNGPVPSSAQEPDEDDIKKKKPSKAPAETSKEPKAEGIDDSKETKPVKPNYGVKKSDKGLEWNLEIPIYKIDGEQRLVGGVVYEPDTVDAQGDSASEQEIQKAAHNFMIDSKTVGIMHKEDAGPRAKIVESYTAPARMQVGNQFVKRGTWIMVVKILDDGLWNMVKNDQITGFSMGGRAVENPQDEGVAV